MTFTVKNWLDTASGGTKINSTALKDLETRLSAYTDTVGASGSAPNANEAIRFVSGNGNDSNNGLTPAVPMLTLAAAYASLPTPPSAVAPIGRIYIAPGRYDVGAGLALTRGKPAAFIGTVAPPPYVTSTLTAPLTLNCAIIYSSTGAASLVTTIAGTAASQMNGLHFENLLFEFAQSTTKIGLDLNSTWYTTVRTCYGFADKTSGAPGPAAVDAQLVFSRDDTTYGGSGTDASWHRIDNNHVINMALGTWGDTSGNNNQHVFTSNIGLGLSHSNTSCLPFISIIHGNRCIVRDSNIEAYNVGIKFDSCWESQESGTGGEFVDVLLDIYNTKGCLFQPAGTSMYALGSTTPLVTTPLLVRGDAFVKACTFILTSVWFTGNTQQMWPPPDAATNPSVSLAARSDNRIITPLAQHFASVQAANYTLVLGDATCVVEGTKGTAQTVTIPPQSSVAFPIGTEIPIVQMGAGQITITAGAGVTLRTARTLTTRVQYSVTYVRMRALDEWVVSGDLT